MPQQARKKLTISECEGGWHLQWHDPAAERDMGYLFCDSIGRPVSSDSEVFVESTALLTRVNELISRK